MSMGMSRQTGVTAPDDRPVMVLAAMAGTDAVFLDVALVCGDVQAAVTAAVLLGVLAVTAQTVERASR